MRDGNILFLQDIINDNNKYLLDIIDSNGYKYLLLYKSFLSATVRSNSIPHKFFHGNHYTKENINHYLELHGVPLSLKQDIPTSNISRVPLEFIDSEGNFHYISWNNIKSNTLRYTDEYLRQNNDKNALTKEKVIELVLEMQKGLDRPVKQKDFILNRGGKVGIRYIEKYWGTLTNMKRELGMKTAIENVYKLNATNYKSEIKEVCDQVYRDEKRKIIFVSDFKKYQQKIPFTTYKNACIRYGDNIKEVINSFGYSLQKAGCGFNYEFIDGENVYSSHEYNFSKFLRNNGYVYGINYYRDIPYSTLSNTYKGSMTCDYKIILKDTSVIYIELAGILSHREHEVAFLNGTPITKSKSKNNYCQKLYLKRNILESAGCRYKILLPSEINDKTFNDILLTL